MTPNPPNPDPARFIRLQDGLLLFGSSYTPLWLIFAVTNQGPFWVGAAFGILSFLGFVFTYYLIHKSKQTSVWPMTVLEVQDKGGEVSGYLATYLLPFIAGAPDNLRLTVAYAFYFLVASIVFARSSLLLINPTYYIFGYRLAYVRIQSGWRLVLCRRPVQVGEVLTVSDHAGTLGLLAR